MSNTLSLNLFYLSFMGFWGVMLQSFFTIFVSSIIYSGSWISSLNWFKLKIDPPQANLAWNLCTTPLVWTGSRPIQFICLSTVERSSLPMFISLVLMLSTLLVMLTSSRSAALPDLPKFVKYTVRRKLKLGLM